MPTNKGHKLNTATARKLVAHYERLTGTPFPLGKFNAKVESLNKHAGDWSWQLTAISGANEALPLGSVHAASQCVLNPKLIEVDNGCY